MRTSSVRSIRAKRDVSYQATQSSKQTFHDLTVELAKTQVSLRSFLDEPVVFTELLQLQVQGTS